MTSSKRRGCGGCGGCGLVLLVLLVLVLIWAAIVPFRVLQRIGLQKSAAERLLGGPPDREAAQVLAGRLQAAGMDMRGVRVQVMELSNTGERVAFTVLDASKGFDPFSGDSDAATEPLSDIAALVGDLDIDRIAIYYVDEDGQPLFTFTHHVEAIQALAQGTLSEEDFLDGLGVDFNLQRILGEVQQ
jgi:hypothetical protein